MQPYLDAMRRYADFKGRTSRRDFWIFTGIVIALWVVGWIVGAAILPSNRPTGASGGDLLSRIVMLGHLLPIYAIQARRLHDVDRSGWWMLTGPVALFFFLQPSTPGPNRFDGGVVGAPLAARVDTTVEAERLDQLEKLGNLRAAGTIDDAEFERMKAAILSTRT